MIIFKVKEESKGGGDEGKGRGGGRSEEEKDAREVATSCPFHNDFWVRKRASELGGR